MELNLYPAKASQLPPIHRIVVHDPEGNTQFVISYDGDQLVFSAPDSDITDTLVQSKEVLTASLGIEALGSFISGAQDKQPLYRHFLSIYFHKSNGTFHKRHITVESQLERMDLSHSMLLATELHTVLAPIFKLVEQHKSVEPNQFPLLRKLLFRDYNHELYRTHLDQKFAKMSPEIVELVENPEISSLVVGFTTISGAMLALHSLKGTVDRISILNHLAESSLNCAGSVIDNGLMTWWIPYTKDKVGKLNRAIATTLVTLNYAGSKRQDAAQTQQNIAYKYHDLLEIVGSDSSAELQTNLGNLICAIEFDQKTKNDLTTMMGIASKVIDPLRKYGTEILRDVAKQGFEPIA